MQLTISKKNDVPVREQIVLQIIMGISSDEIKANQKLPSTRELARRLKIHSNTVSAAYQVLEKRGWVKFKSGSGVYVLPQSDVPLDKRYELDHIISAFINMARSKGYSLPEIRDRIKFWLELQPPDHFLVIEPDSELRNILVAEIEETTKFPVIGTSFGDCKNPAILTGAIPTALYGHTNEVRKSLSLDTSCIFLRTASAQKELKQLKALPSDALITVVSHWSEFLNWARTILVAAGINPSTLNLHKASGKGWQTSLRVSTFIVTDSVVCKEISPKYHISVFRIISESSLAELNSFVKQFLASQTVTS